MNSVENKTNEKNLRRQLTKSVKEAVLIASGIAILALLGNLVHPDKIPYFADEAYEILVPCPEPGGKVLSIKPEDPSLSAPGQFFIDARTKVAFDTRHHYGAVNVMYDYLDPTPKDVLIRLAKDIAHSKAKRVIVYGDGDQPDTGEQLGKEISGYGIKNVYFVKGGAPVLEKQVSPGGSQ